MASRLRAQITLSPNSKGTAQAAGQEMVRILAASGRQLRVKVLPEGALVAGGQAVHCALTLSENDVVPFLPPGTQFEVWESGRVGYGTVLGRW